jgi:hypothetical protein
MGKQEMTAALGQGGDLRIKSGLARGRIAERP